MSKRPSPASTLAEATTRLTGSSLPISIEAWDGSVWGDRRLPTLKVNDPVALVRLLHHPGELGLSQAYVTGEIDVDRDLATVLQSFRGVGEDLPRPGWPSRLRAALRLLGLARRQRVSLRRPAAPDSQAKVGGRRHSPGRDGDVVSHHYDLSNEFYALFLDSPTMAYSSGYWKDADNLEQAQLAKLDLVCDKAGLAEGGRLLDVGCGWGGLSTHAAATRRASVTGITLSRAQAEWGRRRVGELGLGDQVEIRVVDYREFDEEGFDAVISLEMGEHVGDRNYPVYLRQLRRAVEPGGRVVIQQMSRRGRHRGGGPFIESFIAPDMSMRPLGETVDMVERAGFEVLDVEGLREDYVLTIEAWAERFEKRWDEAVELVGEEVARVWRLYLVGASQSFREGRMGVEQIVARRREGPGRRKDVGRRADVV